MILQGALSKIDTPQRYWFVPLLALSFCLHLASTILRVGALPTVIKEPDQPSWLIIHEGPSWLLTSLKFHCREPLPMKVAFLYLYRILDQMTLQPLGTPLSWTMLNERYTFMPMDSPMVRVQKIWDLRRFNPVGNNLKSHIIKYELSGFSTTAEIMSESQLCIFNLAHGIFWLPLALFVLGTIISPPIQILFLTPRLVINPIILAAFNPVDRTYTKSWI
ncbi:hypothetical protein B0H13DRAFT_1872056 [Mycena leptocephala]|nr:hypothetical protein B0H13DRAFT_1872056 [Mycena leptocephala]